MRFLADENCDFSLVHALRTMGHDVVAVCDERPGATDDAIIELTLAESRILLTEDKDFGQLVFASVAKSSGVIFIRFPAKARRAMVRTVVEFIDTHRTMIEGCFIVVQPGRIRISERIPDK